MKGLWILIIVSGGQATEINSFKTFNQCLDQAHAERKLVNLTKATVFCEREGKASKLVNKDVAKDSDLG